MTGFHGKSSDYDGKSFFVPSSTISFNKFWKNTYFALAVADLTYGNTYSLIDDVTGQIQASSSSSGEATINAPNNYWGNHGGPKGMFAGISGQGNIVSESKVSISSVLHCIDDNFCSLSTTTCGQSTALLDGSTCVANAAAC